MRAAKAISSAEVEGEGIGAAEITFRPAAVRAGDYAFDVGTAGSTTLIAQTLVTPLILANAPSHIILEGGTHNPLSPPFEFLEAAWLPVLDRMGASTEAALITPGFYPAGGGRLELTIVPAAKLSVIDLSSRGKLLDTDATAIVSHLPLSIAHRELAVIEELLAWPKRVLHAREETRSKGPGNVVIVTLMFEQLTEVFTGFGQRGVRAEKVAGEVAGRVKNYLGSSAAVGVHLADQLLVPLALAGGGRFTTLSPSRHTMTNIRIIETFLPVTFQVERGDRNLYSIVVRRRG